MRYKVGDKVMVRGDLEVGKRYGNVTFISSMEKNKTFKILFARESENYDLDDEYKLCYSSEMLRPVKFKIWCETEEEKQAVLEELEKEGYVWWDDCLKPTKSSGKNAKCGLYVSENGLSISYDDDYYIRDDRVELTTSEFTGIDFSEKIIITKTLTGVTATYGDKTVTVDGKFEKASKQALAKIFCPFKKGDTVQNVDGFIGTVGTISFGDTMIYVHYEDFSHNEEESDLELYTEPPYNAKLFCVDGNGSDVFKTGHIYEVKDGIIAECVEKFTMVFKNIEEINENLLPKFMEVKK